MLLRLCAHRFRRPTFVVAACVGILAGVALARWRTVASAEVLWLLAPGLLVLRRRTVVAVLVATVLGLCIGWWRGSIYATGLAAYGPLMGQKVTIAGRATNDAVYGPREQLTFDMDKMMVTTRAGPQTLVGSLSIGGFGAGMIYRGDLVEVTGKLLPALGGNQGSIDFGQLHVVRPDHGGLIDAWRRRFVAGMQSALPEPDASFGLGLLVGQRNTLPAATSQILLTVGLTHIIAVSGYNLTVILQIVRRLCVRRSKYQTVAISIALILLFLAFAGSSPSLARAAIISTLGLLTWYYGREAQPIVLVLLAAAASVLANPLYLWGNVSWYLSFLAFFGVVVLGPNVVRRVFGAREPPLVAIIIIESFCAEIMTLPYVLHVFGQMSLLALPANVLVAAWVPLAMGLSLVAGLAGMSWAAAAGWFACPARWLLGYMLDLATALGRLPHAFVQHVDFSFGMMLASYGILLFVAGVLAGKGRTKSGIIAINQRSVAEGVTV